MADEFEKETGRGLTFFLVSSTILVNSTRMGRLHLECVLTGPGDESLFGGLASKFQKGWVLSPLDDFHSLVCAVMQGEIQRLRDALQQEQTAREVEATFRRDLHEELTAYKTGFGELGRALYQRMK
jgi:hypothetical protein